MATLFSPYRSFSSTASGSPQSSLPFSYCIPVHDHILPPGWHCKCDPKTNKYYFYNDWDSWRFNQYGSSYSSRSSSPSNILTSLGKYFQPYLSRFKSNEITVQRISRMFPTIEESHIQYLLRIHQNRESQVIAALINEGLWKSDLVQPDETLFLKFKNYFPTVDPDFIEQLLIKYNNSEHEVIAEIIASLCPNKSHYPHYSNESPKIKLRYIKMLYPEVEESVLFDFLYTYDHNAQLVIDKLNKMGFKKRDIVKSSSKITESAKSLNLKSLKSKKTLSLKGTQLSQEINEKQKGICINLFTRDTVFEKLCNSFPKIDFNVINMALECADLDEERARIFLSALPSQDSETQFFLTFLPSEQENFITLASKAIQTQSFIEITPGSPITIKKSEIKKNFIQEVGTSTTEDGIIVEEKKKSLAKGPNSNNRKGAIGSLICTKSWRGPNPKNRVGQDLTNKKGANNEIQIGPSMNFKGPDPKNRKGPNILLRKK